MWSLGHFSVTVETSQNLFSFSWADRHTGHHEVVLKQLSQFLGSRDLSSVKNLLSFGDWLLLVISELISHLGKYDHTTTQLETLSEERESELFHWLLLFLRNPIYTSPRWREEGKLLRGLSQFPFGVAHSGTCVCFLQSNRNGLDLGYHKNASWSVL